MKCNVFTYENNIYANEQDNQAISTDRLRALQRFDPRPIDVVVFHGLNGDTLF